LRCEPSSSRPSDTAQSQPEGLSKNIATFLGNKESQINHPIFFLFNNDPISLVEVVVLYCFYNQNYWMPISSSYLYLVNFADMENYRML